jgi:hypothetical protein
MVFSQGKQRYMEETKRKNRAYQAVHVEVLKNFTLPHLNPITNDKSPHFSPQHKYGAGLATFNEVVLYILMHNRS